MLGRLLRHLSPEGPHAPHGLPISPRAAAGSSIVPATQPHRPGADCCDDCAGQGYERPQASYVRAAPAAMSAADRAAYQASVAPRPDVACGRVIVHGVVVGRSAALR